MKPVYVLLVDDDEDEFVLTRTRLSEIDGDGFVLEWASDYEAARTAMQRRVHDVYLVDYRLGERSGLDLLSEVPDLVHDAPVIVLTGVGNREVDLEAMRLGATSYLAKAEINSRVLERTIRYALEIQRARLEQRRTADRLRRHAAQQSVLAELGHRLLTALEADRIVATAVGAATDGLGASAGAFFAVEDEALALGASHQWPTMSEEARGALQDWLATAMRAGSPVMLPPDVLLATELRALGYGSAAAVAVRGPDHVLGVLLVLGALDQVVADSDLAFLEAAAQVLAHALGRQYAIAEQGRLQERLRRSEMMSALGRIVAGVAHETRNPLFGILATLDAFESRFTDQPETTHYVRVLRTEVQRLNGLMSDLLEYGRPKPTEIVRGAIGPVIEDARRACAIMAAEAGVTVVTHVAPDLPTIDLDPPRLVQVLQNLIQNAVQHSSAGAEVTITAETGTNAEGGVLVCRVEDVGCGFEPRDLPGIFEPFFSRRRNGTGLGLAIVHRIVEQHGGTVTAANRDPCGAVMTIELPLPTD